MESELTQGDEIIRDAVLHLFGAGGKRFRPLFTVLLAAPACFASFVRPLM